MPSDIGTCQSVRNVDINYWSPRVTGYSWSKCP